jgi:hypothetical protein
MAKKGDMRTIIRLSFAAALAVSVGFVWTVGQTGLQQTNRNLCELWASLPLPKYESCEFQNALVYVWACAALVAVIWLLLEFFRLGPVRHHVERFCVIAKAWFLRHLKMIEPYHIIILGLVIIVAGLVWQWRKTPEVVALRTEITNLQNELANALKTKTPITNAPRDSSSATIQSVPQSNSNGAPPDAIVVAKPSKNYFASEKTDLGNLLSSISDRLNKEGLDAVNEARRLSNAPEGRQTQEQLALLWQHTENARNLTIILSRSIWDDIIGKNPKYRNELTQIVGSNHPDNLPIAPFQRAVGVYSRDLAIVSNEYKNMNDVTKGFMGELFKRDAQIVYDTSGKFQGWIQECIERIDNMREALSP